MKNKIHVAVISLFLAFILGFGIAFWVVPDKDFSTDENRPLQGFPTVTAEDWLDGKVSERLINYYSDQFPMRSTWVGLHALSELAMGRGESSGVLLGENGQLAVRRFDAYLSRLERLTDTDYYSESHVQKGVSALIALEQKLEIPLTVLLAPRTVDVTVGDLGYPAELSDRLDTTVQTSLAEGGVHSVDLLPTFREMHDAGEYVYYRTDHHWTTRGAYTAYTAVMKDFGMEDKILPEDFFAVREIPDFYGTTYSRAGVFFISPDTLEIWNAKDGSDTRFRVYAPDGTPVIESGFISESYLDGKDKYGAFLDGTHSILLIEDKEAKAAGVARPRLLIARDSFANSMVPFLARHFDIVFADLSGGQTNLSRLAAEYGCERVLVVCNYENLVTSDCVARIE